MVGCYKQVTKVLSALNILNTFLIIHFLHCQLLLQCRIIKFYSIHYCYIKSTHIFTKEPHELLHNIYKNLKIIV